ncbi:MAG: hypothetical protein ACYC9K_00855 [Sulfuricaulis sp.]
MDFFILGLPRSRSAWLSAFLTTDKTLCYHDALALCRTPNDMHKLGDGRLTGNADTGLALFYPWVNAQRAKRIVIKRPMEEVWASVEQLGLPTDGLPLLERCLSRVHADLTINFNEIDNFLSTLWRVCSGGFPFDEKRAELFKSLNIQTTRLAWAPERIEHLKNQVLKGEG